MTQLTPQEEDPVVHGLLANLDQFSPSPGFADRVMSQVWQPAPTWIQRVTHVCDTALGRKRVWAVVGGLAATSAVAMIAIVVAAFTYRVHIETTWTVMVSMAFDLWRFGVQSTAAITVFAARLVEPLVVSPTMLLAFAISTTLVLGLSGLGLQRTIRGYRNERIALHARR